MLRGLLEEASLAAYAGDGGRRWSPVKRFYSCPCERCEGLSSTVAMTHSGSGMFGEGTVQQTS